MWFVTHHFRLRIDVQCRGCCLKCNFRTSGNSVQECADAIVRRRCLFPFQDTLAIVCQRGIAHFFVYIETYNDSLRPHHNTPSSDEGSSAYHQSPDLSTSICTIEPVYDLRLSLTRFDLPKFQTDSLRQLFWCVVNRAKIMYA